MTDDAARRALAVERERLLARLAAIDAQLTRTTTRQTADRPPQQTRTDRLD